MCGCVCTPTHSPYSISLIEGRDHGRRVLRHKSHQQLEHIVDVLILQRKRKVNKGGRGNPEGRMNRGLIGRRERRVLVDMEGGGLRRSVWHNTTRIDIIVTEEYILFSPLLHHFSCCHCAGADSHSHSFKWTITPAHDL